MEVACDHPLLQVYALGSASCDLPSHWRNLLELQAATGLFAGVYLIMAFTTHFLKSKN